MSSNKGKMIKMGSMNPDVNTYKKSMASEKYLNDDLTPSTDSPILGQNPWGSL